MDRDPKQIQETWDAFLSEWPIERLRRMTLAEYATAGDDHAFIAWIERRLDEIGSIWGGSAFKFGIYNRKNKTPKPSGGGASYTLDYAWYTKYGATPDEAFAKVKALVLQVAEAAASGNYAAINAVDLGEAYKWKIAFHYQDRTNLGVIAAFKPERLRAWLKGRVPNIPQQVSELHRAVLALGGGQDIITLSREVWLQTAASEPTGSEVGDEPGEAAESEAALDQPLNLILYGPPGTGKTYLTVDLAVKICDGVLPGSRAATMGRYRELRNLRRIRFVTFHPSFSYEEFVEGIRPSTENGQVRYDVRPGIFRQVVTHARELYESRGAQVPDPKLGQRRLFKCSLGDSTRSEDDWIFADCIENDYICLGWAAGIDFAGCDTQQAIRERYLASKRDGRDSDFAITALDYLKNQIRSGDLVLISDGNTRFRAIAEVTGPYSFVAREAGYEHRRPVRWLWSSSESVPAEVVYSRRLSQMSIYQMKHEEVSWPALQELLVPRRGSGQAPSCVLIIDEINRANLAKTLGELITLIEPSKRLGQPDEQETELPYSGGILGVPPNLYLIGTMNTADRSIALMDTALRRRFAFREMTPQPSLLETDVEGVDLQALLRAMNARIEGLFDRDHVLGHTYLMDVHSFEDLVIRFRNQIIPLLQEYFFDDWRRIQQVFNDAEQPPELQIIVSLDRPEGDDSLHGRGRRYQVNPAISPAAIQKIYQ
jgi:5-methylcytosine-specific restriction enzyme B